MNKKLSLSPCFSITSVFPFSFFFFLHACIVTVSKTEKGTSVVEVQTSVIFAFETFLYIKIFLLQRKIWVFWEKVGSIRELDQGNSSSPMLTCSIAVHLSWR